MGEEFGHLIMQNALYGSASLHVLMFSLLMTEDNQFELKRLISLLKQ